MRQSPGAKTQGKEGSKSRFAVPKNNVSSGAIKSTNKVSPEDMNGNRPYDRCGKEEAVLDSTITHARTEDDGCSDFTIQEKVRLSDLSVAYDGARINIINGFFRHHRNLDKKRNFCNTHPLTVSATNLNRQTFSQKQQARNLAILTRGTMPKMNISCKFLGPARRHTSWTLKYS